MDKPHRRVTDIDKTQEIEALIMTEDDQKYRTLLLVVHSLNAGIRENTAAQKTFQSDLLDHQKKLDVHLQEYRQRTQVVESFINQGKGVKLALGWGWKILLGMFAMIQAALLTLGSHYVDEMNDLRDMAQANAVQHAEFAARLAAAERAKKK